MIRQLSVFLENTKGRLARLTGTLAEAGVDLLAISMADTDSFGVLRILVNDIDKATAALKASGYTFKVTDVLVAVIPDIPGGLNSILKRMVENDISVEYLYSLVRTPDNGALVLFKVDAPERAALLLERSGVELYDMDKVNQLS